MIHKRIQVGDRIKMPLFSHRDNWRIDVPYIVGHGYLFNGAVFMPEDDVPVSFAIEFIQKPDIYIIDVLLRKRFQGFFQAVFVFAAVLAGLFVALAFFSAFRELDDTFP